MRPANGSLSLREYGPSPGSHAHDHFQVLLGLQGELELEVQGKGQRIAVGEGCVIAPGQRHDFEARAHARCLVLDTRTSDGPTAPAPPRTPLRRWRWRTISNWPWRKATHGLFNTAPCFCSIAGVSPRQHPRAASGALTGRPWPTGRNGICTNP